MTWVSTIRCRACGRSYTPTGDAVRSGPQVYRFCVPCRVAREQSRHDAAITEVRTMRAELASGEKREVVE